MLSLSLLSVGIVHNDDGSGRRAEPQSTSDETTNDSKDREKGVLSFFGKKTKSCVCCAKREGDVFVDPLLKGRCGVAAGWVVNRPREASSYMTDVALVVMLRVVLVLLFVVVVLLFVVAMLLFVVVKLLLRVVVLFLYVVVMRLFVVVMLLLFDVVMLLLFVVVMLLLFVVVMLLLFEAASFFSSINAASLNNIRNCYKYCFWCFAFVFLVFVLILIVFVIVAVSPASVVVPVISIAVFVVAFVDVVLSLASVLLFSPSCALGSAAVGASVRRLSLRPPKRRLRLLRRKQEEVAVMGKPPVV